MFEDISDISLDINPLEIKRIELTSEQKLIILKRWEQLPPPSVSELVKTIFPNIDIKLQDARSNYGRVIKEFLVEKGLDIKVESNIKRTVELTEAHKEYILNNAATMRPLEMARELFGNIRLSPASLEARAVNNQFRLIDPKIIYGNEVPENDYNPPKQIMHVLSRIRKYVSSTEDWDQRKLLPQQKKCCESLIHYLHDNRFKRQIDSYDKTEDKITFESEFVKYTYNKVELEQEEISQYISLCSFVVMEFNIKSNIEMLQNMMQNEYEENGKAQTNTVESLESARQELNNCTIRQSKLYESLIEKRSEKISKELKDKASLLNLIAMWKQAETRKKMIELANDRKIKLRKEIHELENLDEMKARILGLSEEEIVNG